MKRAIQGIANSAVVAQSIHRHYGAFTESIMGARSRNGVAENACVITVRRWVLSDIVWAARDKMNT